MQHGYIPSCEYGQINAAIEKIREGNSYFTPEKTTNTRRFQFQGLKRRKLVYT